MIRVYSRTQANPQYFTKDRAAELEGVRDGPAGRWLRGTGPLDDDAVANVFASTLRSATIGYDLVIAAPRPISILLANDERQAPAIVAAHQRAVSSAVAYLEDRGAVVRERRFGEVYEEPAQWRRIAAFTHGINRHGEPHLHDHVLVGAHTMAATTALDGRALRAHALTADSLYRAQLRDDIGRTTTWQPWRSFAGAELVAGLDEGYRALWGGHFDDRPAKREWTRDEIKEQWARDLERYEPLTQVTRPDFDRGVVDSHRFAGALSVLSAPHRRDVVAALADAAPLGVDAQLAQRRVDEWLPEARDSRGLREVVLSPRRAMSLGRDDTPSRFLSLEAATDLYRSRDRSSEREGRSR